MYYIWNSDTACKTDITHSHNLHYDNKIMQSFPSLCVISNLTAMKNARCAINLIIVDERYLNTM